MSTQSHRVYVAFLRGINVGGHNSVKMADLKAAFESLSSQNVRTVLSSGNVLFSAESTTVAALTPRIERTLREELGRDVSVIARTIEDLQRLVGANPFKRIKITPQTRLYVTFLSEKPTPAMLSAKVSQGGYQIVRVTDREVCFTLTLSPVMQTTDVMADLEKRFGRNITTRNWNTILKIVDAASR